jgi:Flp pilus assembly pilin Flp
MDNNNERSRNDFSAPREYSMMARPAALFLWFREFRKVPRRGQTMSEYALILAAVALVVFVAYQTMGQSIESMVEWGAIHNDLLSS